MMNEIFRSDSLPCPECPDGRVTIVPATTLSAIAVPNFTVGTHREYRERDCLIAACNACEFAQEMNPKTGTLIMNQKMDAFVGR